MSFTSEEREAMRLADEEIDREFADKYVADQVSRDMDQWLDELAIMDLMDNKSCHRRKRQKQYSAAYYESHRDEIAAKKAAYYESHRDEIAARQAAYRTTMTRMGKTPARSKSPRGRTNKWSAPERVAPPGETADANIMRSRRWPTVSCRGSPGRTKV